MHIFLSISPSLMEVHGNNVLFDIHIEINQQISHKIHNNILFIYFIYTMQETIGEKHLYFKKIS